MRVIWDGDDGDGRISAGLTPEHEFLRFALYILMSTAASDNLGKDLSLQTLLGILLGNYTLFVSDHHPRGSEMRYRGLFHQKRPFVLGLNHSQKAA